MPDIQEFYGREREWTRLLDRLSQGAATSIVGPRRSGKTWRLQYIQLRVAQETGHSILIASIDATSPLCATIAGVVLSIVKEFATYQTYQGEDKRTLVSLERIVRDVTRQGYRPVLCIDEFEHLTQRVAFDHQFFSGLRAIAQSELGLIVASTRPLHDLAGYTLNINPFFTLFEKRTLQPFSLQEAETFVNAKSTQAHFIAQERSLLLRYGQTGDQQWSPARLQLVGTLLLEDKKRAQQGHADFYRSADPAYWEDFEQR